MNTPIKILLVLVSLIVIIAAAWWVLVKSGEEGNKFVFVCPEGERIEATFYESGVMVVLPDGREMTVDQAVSASGARYATEDESFVFWNRGNEVFVEENGTVIYDDCVEEGDVSSAEQEEEGVRELVGEFSERLKNVSLLAPNASETIQAQYGSFVTSELLTSWMADPSEAPGRVTSSPWPDQIEIESVEKTGILYVVRGNVVEMTSEGSAGTIPVTLLVSLEGEEWKISGYQEGARDTGSEEVVTREAEGLMLEATYEGNNTWRYVITGSLPTPCYSLVHDAAVRESYPEQVAINVTVTPPEVDVFCAQVIQDIEETGMFSASGAAQVTFHVSQ